MKELISGSFESVQAANAAIDRLLAAGYPRDEISVMMHADMRDDDEPGATGARIVRDAAGGGLIGGALGAIIAASLAATGAIGAAIITGGAAAPILAGPIAAALAGGGAGAAAGGILGGLAGFGLSQEHTRRLLSELEAGRIVVAVRTDENTTSLAHQVLDHYPQLASV